MRTRAVWPLAVVLGIFAAGCGPATSEETVTTPAVSATPDTIAPTTGVSAEPSAANEDVSAYLVEMANLAADIDSQAAEFECSYNEQFSPGFCDGNFVEEGGEFEPPPEPTEEEQLEYQRGLWLGMFDLHLAHADVLESTVAPSGFESAHQAYAAAYRAYFALLRDGVAGLATLSEFELFFAPLFDPLAAVPADLEGALFRAVDACGSLEEMAAEAGVRADIGCPTPPPKPVSVDVEVGDVWVAAPNPLEVGEGLITMRITNTGAEPIRPVVLDISEGEPLDLPIVNGVVDLSRSGEFDPASGYAEFYLHYAGENWEVNGDPLELSPGQSVDAVIWSEQVLVVFDYRQGEFESGAHLVIDRSEGGAGK